MGENNASTARRGTASKDLFLSAAAIYSSMFPSEFNDDSNPSEDEIIATVQVIYGIGWKNHDSQQKPDERGTASAKIGEDIVIDQG
ncbi:hypothetical protein TL16_g10425 [Triparma laevis f. inornata]|uniref:Uncharacterized protein n=1 Tax=Triparma laevis f. inornata TaxID=1714386 RepID=A0A9W7BCI1_9STRA|nr:hypothetical protein TL16_g10425 [Triparma laevis f. inornata]